MPDYVVSVGEPHGDDIGSVAERLRAAGLQVTDVLPLLGIVLGSADEQAVPALRSVPGVDAVERSHELRAG